MVHSQGPEVGPRDQKHKVELDMTIRRTGPLSGVAASPFALQVRTAVMENGKITVMRLHLTCFMDLHLPGMVSLCYHRKATRNILAKGGNN